MQCCYCWWSRWITQTLSRSWCVVNTAGQPCLLYFFGFESLKWMTMVINWRFLMLYKCLSSCTVPSLYGLSVLCAIMLCVILINNAWEPCISFYFDFKNPWYRWTWSSTGDSWSCIDIFHHARYHHHVLLYVTRYHIMCYHVLCYFNQPAMLGSHVYYCILIFISIRIILTIMLDRTSVDTTPKLSGKKRFNYQRENHLALEVTQKSL